MHKITTRIFRTVKNPGKAYLFSSLTHDFRVDSNDIA